MYQNNISTKEFLFSFYIQLEKNIKEILKLIDNKATAENNRRIYEKKNNIIKAFDILSANSNDSNLINTYMFLSSLIISNNKDNLIYVLSYIENIKNT